MTPAERSALQALVAGEQAAAWAYGVVGGQAGRAHRAAAAARLAWHSSQGDLLAEQLTRAGAAPPTAAAAYALPFAVRSPRAARRLAVHVERSVTALYADLVAAAAGALRQQAAGWLTECAVHEHRWGGAPQAFPGLPERLNP